MYKDSKHIDNLIARYLAGEVSPEEQQQLMQWMDESDENKKYFGDIQFVHDKAVASHKYQRVNTDKAWNNVREQMKLIQTKKVQRSDISMPFYKTYFFRVAASLILLTGLSWFLYIYFSGNKKSMDIVNITSTDSTLTHTFSDNTQVVLNCNTKISYTTNYKEKKRELNLSGEAFIEVEHSTAMPLIVRAEETFIKDIGTSFNVKAYPGSDSIEVFVESGEVAFYTLVNTGIKISQGETGVYYKTSTTFRKHQLINSNVLSYKTRIFVFQNTRLIDAVLSLNSVYDKKITIENPNLYDCSITVTFNNESLNNIVEIIAETIGLKVLETDNGYILKGEYCISQP